VNHGNYGADRIGCGETGRTETTGSVVLYKAPDESIALDVKLRDETVWLSLTQMADLFERDNSVNSRHLRNVYATGELERRATVAFFATVQSKGERRVKRGTGRKRPPHPSARVPDWL
jgi:hypothetical protein